MTTHSCGKIQWTCITENVKFNHNVGRFEIQDLKKLEHVAIQMLTLVDDFSKTVQKKKSKNPLIQKYTDEQLNPLTWVRTSYELTHCSNYWLFGPIQYLVECYVYLNLILAGFDPAFLRPLGALSDFWPCDNDLPEFLCDEFNRIFEPVSNIIQNRNPDFNTSYLPGIFRISRRDFTKTTLNSEEIKNIKDFCGLLFRCIYTAHRVYELDYEIFLDHVNWLFGIRKHEDGYEFRRININKN